MTFIRPRHLLSLATVMLFGVTSCHNSVPRTSLIGPDVPFRNASPQPSLGPLPSANVALPAQAVFYYPWYPETWQVGGVAVADQPVLGHYRSDDPAVIGAHIQALDYAGIEVAIASWWGPGTHHEEVRIPKLLGHTHALGSPLKWALYYEREGYDDPNLAELEADLQYLRRYFGPSYAFVEDKPVVFVYSADDTDCEVVARWRAATAGYTDLYVVLKVFPGYQRCGGGPSGWHQYGPADNADRQPGFSYSISPGFWRVDEPAPRLPRNLQRWHHDVQAMIAADDPWQLITTFNEWGEGTATESAEAWQTGRYGGYLEVLAELGRRVRGPTREQRP